MIPQNDCGSGSDAHFEGGLTPLSHLRKPCPVTPSTPVASQQQPHSAGVRASACSSRGLGRAPSDGGLARGHTARGYGAHQRNRQHATGSIVGGAAPRAHRVRAVATTSGPKMHPPKQPVRPSKRSVASTRPRFLFMDATKSPSLGECLFCPGGPLMIAITSGRGPRFTRSLHRARTACAPWQERPHSAAGRGRTRPNSEKTAAAHSMSVTGLGFANDLPLPVWSIIWACVDEGRAGAERTQGGMRGHDAYWPLATYPFSFLKPSPSGGGGAHRPLTPGLTPSCPPSPGLAYPPFPFPREVVPTQPPDCPCLTAPCRVHTEEGNGPCRWPGASRRTAPHRRLWETHPNGGCWARGGPLVGPLPRHRWSAQDKILLACPWVSKQAQTSCKTSEWHTHHHGF